MMKKKNNNKGLLGASSSLIGTIIGAGVFGVPFAFAQAGFFAGTIFFVVLAGLLLLLHLMYGEVVDRTSEKHRLIGYAKRYFGNGGRDFMSFSVLIGVYGSMVVYLLLANDFLNIIFEEVASFPYIWSFVFWFLLSIAIIRGIKTVAKAEVFIISALLFTLALIIFKGAPAIEAVNFTGVNWDNFFLPYGVVLFALGGFAAVPEIRSLLPREGRVFFKSLFSGFLIAALVSYLFAFVVVGVSGINTTEDAINGLLPYLGPGVIYLGAVFGILTLATSYLVIGVNLKESFMFDWNISKIKSNILAVFIPAALILMGVRNFIFVIAITGSIVGAVNGSMIALLFLKTKKEGDQEPEFSLPIPKIVVWALIAMLVVGGLYETISVIK